MASKSKLALLKARPLCIICAKPEEVGGIAFKLGIADEHISSTDIREIRDGHDFYLGTFKIVDEKGEKERYLEYYLTSPTRQGIQTFAIQACSLFHVIRPQFVIHAGVCAGYGKEGIRLKHVIFGDTAINYEEGKWVVENDHKLFKPSFRTAEVTVGGISAFAQRNEPNYKYGGYISGSAVRQDANELFELFRGRVNRDICALDMEASAFLMLCQYIQHYNIRCLGVIKGVSDLGDSKKAQDPATYTAALNATAEAVKEWAIFSLRNVEWRIDEDEEAISFAQGYYDNFVRLTLDAISSGQDVAVASGTDEMIPSDKVKGIKVIMPRNDDPREYGEPGHIAEIVRNHGLIGVKVGQGNLSRTLYYKYGYLIDFPRNLNKFVESDDRIHCTQSFQRALRRKSYFLQTQNREIPFATATSWEDFQKFAPLNLGPATTEAEAEAAS